MTLTESPHPRIRLANAVRTSAPGQYVLYWMTATRRAQHNFALDRAVRWCERLQLPLLVYEPLSASYPWTSARFHAFVADGMRDNAAAFAAAGVRYLPHIEPEPGAAKGALAELASQAALVVTDEYPCYFHPKLQAAAARALKVPLEVVDSTGILPLASCSSSFPTAYAFRRHLQKNLRPYLDEAPRENRLEGLKLPREAALPQGFERRFPATRLEKLDPCKLPILQSVGVVNERGGSSAARAALRQFVELRLSRYGTERSEPTSDASSGLSPWIHFGHLSVHEILQAVARREGWSADSVSDKASGKREGWWNMSPSAESFLDELITWRELGYQFAHKRPDHDRYESLPEWARATLEEHARDPREFTYSLEQFEGAKTHDALWNAAQRQLLREGRMHNYLRMLWGKKILEWTASPREALAVMIELNNKYALDGRDPNSYSGIFWVLGRFDRPWAPKRKIFGSIRYMSSTNTAKKFEVRPYLAKYAPLTSAR
jgi:deoxyribodipyrimidine photo-lyase